MVDVAPGGSELLDRLRGREHPRDRIDAELVRRLRALLERAAAPASELGLDGPIRLTKSRLRQVLVCERHLVASLEATGRTTVEMLRGRLFDLLFAQVVMGVPLGDDPVAEALAAAQAAGQREVAAEWEALSPDEREEVHYSVPGVARQLAERWPVLPASAWPRLQEPLRVELAAGRVLLTGRADLVLGAPAPDRVGTTVLDVKSGQRRFDDIEDARWYALLETIRHGAPPFQTGNYYLRDGQLHLEVVRAESLEHHAGKVADAIGRMVHLAAGASPAMTPSGLCPWCPALPRCAPGRRHAAERAGGSGPFWVSDGDDDDDDDDDSD
jgi:hypothetical protein